MAITKADKMKQKAESSVAKAKLQGAKLNAKAQAARAKSTAS